MVVEDGKCDQRPYQLFQLNLSFMSRNKNTIGLCPLVVFCLAIAPVLNVLQLACEANLSILCLA